MKASNHSDEVPSKASLPIPSLKLSSSPSKSSTESDEATGPKLPKEAKGLKAKVILKTKALLERNVEKSIDADGHQKDQSVQNTNEDAAFHPRTAKQHQISPPPKSNLVDKAKVAVATSSEAITHPRKTARAKVKRITAGKISSIQKPYTLPTTGTELLEAYDAYSHSEGSRSSEEASDSEGTEEQASRKQTRERKKARFQRLEAQRESMRVAWTTRHTDRVRVVPKEHIRFPERRAFIDRNDKGEATRSRWESWLGQILIYYTQDFCVQYIDDFDKLPFDIDTARNHAERLVMASGPWQIWAMDVRSVYRWDDPYRTGKWLLLYLALWYLEYIGAFLWASILYYTIKNRYYPSSMKHLRAAIQRSADRESAAFQFGEFVDRHGRDSWLDPLVEQVGPYAQLQLGDLANMLEVLSNFYSWKHPKKTVSSLVFFAACLATSIFADTAFCLKIIWFVVGGSFFVCWPVSSLYPRYRYLVSPFKWVLWDVPTHAEWSFQYLRRHCQESRESMIRNRVEQSFQKEPQEPFLEHYAGRLSTPHPHIEVEGVEQEFDSENTASEDWHSADSSSNILPETHFLSYRSHWEGVTGRLAITPSGLRFVRSIKKQEMWYLPFIEIEEMRKFQGAVRSGSKVLGIKSKLLLEIRRMDGICYTVELRGDRDEVFNYIIGFSGLQWQSLQSGPQKATTHP